MDVVVGRQHEEGLRLNCRIANLLGVFGICFFHRKLRMISHNGIELDTTPDRSVDVVLGNQPRRVEDVALSQDSVKGVVHNQQLDVEGELIEPQGVETLQDPVHMRRISSTSAKVGRRRADVLDFHDERMGDNVEPVAVHLTSGLVNLVMDLRLWLGLDRFS